MLTVLRVSRPCHAVQHIMSYSRGALLAKLDIESAYRIIPVHAFLLGMVWKGRQYVDTSIIWPPLRPETV